MLAGLLQDFDGLGVRHAHEGPLDDELEPLVHAFIDKLGKQREVLGALLQRAPRHRLHELFGQVHVALQITEGHLRLDHPELRGMAGGVRVLGAEGRAEGIDVGERAGERLAFELAADGQVGGFAEEVRLRLLVNVALEDGDAEHLTRALAVASGNDRRVHINEVAFLEELMHGERQPAAHTEHGAEEIRARAQMGNGAQELLGVALLLQRIGRVRRADQLDARGAQLPFLALRRRGHQLSLDHCRRPCRELGEVFRAWRTGIHDHLHVCETGAVVEFEEGEALGVAPGADPTFDGHCFLRFGGCQDVFN